MHTFNEFLVEMKMSTSTAMDILGLKNKYSEDELKKAYRSLSMKYHPDRGGDVDAMKKVNIAFDYLTKNKSASATNTTNWWENAQEKYRIAAPLIIEYLQEKFKPELFKQFFETYFNETFDYNITYSDLTKKYGTVSFVGFNSKFYNKDKTKSFDFDISVSLANVVGSKKPTLSNKPEISFDVSVVANGYANKKKQKMAQRDWSSKNDHTLFEKPEISFPIEKMKKIATGTDATVMKKADFIKALDNEVEVEDYNRPENVFLIPIKDGYVMIDRHVFNRFPMWTISSIGNSKKYSFDTQYSIYYSLEETPKTLDLFLSFKNKTKEEVYKQLIELKNKT